MSTNMLKLNEDKTDVMVISTPAKQKKHVISDISVGLSTVSFAPFVKDLGVFLDCHLNMER